MIKIATWNVNSINARLENLLAWLITEKPDILLLQELKCTEENFPKEMIEDLGYNLAISGQKTYNGVAILSKFPISDIKYEFDNNPVPSEARYIEAWINLKNKSILVSSVYVPNGGELDSEKYAIKLEFMKQLALYSESLLLNSEFVIFGGDFNIALTENDIFNGEELPNQLLFSLPERKSLRAFLASGWVDMQQLDVNDAKQNFTWWDYRGNAFNQNKGARIDYIFGSSLAAQKFTEIKVAQDTRSEAKPSDHAPVIVSFNL